MPRAIRVFVEPIDGITIPGRDTLDVRLRRIFPRGVDTSLEFLPSRAATSTRIDRAFIHGALVAFLASHGGSGAKWVAHVLVGGTYDDQPDALGVMGEEVRAGCAVFADLAKSDDLFLRTLAHELGHLLNLDHMDASNRCVMTDPCPAALTFTFSEIGQHHLLTHDDAHVEPGAGPFGPCVGADTDPVDPHPLPREGARFSVARRAPRRGTMPALRLNLAGGRWPSSRGATALILGQPLLAGIRLAHGRNARPLLVRRGSLGGAEAILEVTQQAGSEAQWERLRPFYCACSRSHLAIRGGETLDHQQAVFFRNGAFVFGSPGRYRLRASVALPGSATLFSTERRIVVLEPETRRHRSQVASLLDPDVGRAVELGGLAGLPGVERTMRTVSHDRGYRHHPLRPWARLILGAHAVREFARHGSARDRREALRHLRALARDPRAPIVARQEGLLWRARVAEQEGFHAATELYERGRGLGFHDQGLQARLAHALGQRSHRRGES